MSHNQNKKKTMCTMLSFGVDTISNIHLVNPTWLKKGNPAHTYRKRKQFWATIRTSFGTRDISLRIDGGS
jgi:DNA-binding transcriptional regulator GbsR (MarR family)